MRFPTLLALLALLAPAALTATPLDGLADAEGFLSASTSVVIHMNLRRQTIERFLKKLPLTGLAMPAIAEKQFAAFERQTGFGVIVNTSFNVRGEPIVCTPEDAWRCFMRTEMDYLSIGPFLLAKKDQSPETAGGWGDATGR